MEKKICQMVSPRLYAVKGIVKKIGEGNNRTITHLTRGGKIFFCKQLWDVTEVFNQCIINNRKFIIINKTIFKCVWINGYWNDENEQYGEDMVVLCCRWFISDYFRLLVLLFLCFFSFRHKFSLSSCYYLHLDSLHAAKINATIHICQLPTWVVLKIDFIYSILSIPVYPCLNFFLF